MPTTVLIMGIFSKKQSTGPFSRVYDKMVGTAIKQTPEQSGKNMLAAFMKTTADRTIHEYIYGYSTGNQSQYTFPTWNDPKQQQQFHSETKQGPQHGPKLIEAIYSSKIDVWMWDNKWRVDPAKATMTAAAFKTLDVLGRGFLANEDVMRSTITKNDETWATLKPVLQSVLGELANNVTLTAQWLTLNQVTGLTGNLEQYPDAAAVLERLQQSDRWFETNYQTLVNQLKTYTEHATTQTQQKANNTAKQLLEAKTLPENLEPAQKNKTAPVMSGSNKNSVSVDALLNQIGVLLTDPLYPLLPVAVAGTQKTQFDALLVELADQVGSFQTPSIKPGAPIEQTLIKLGDIVEQNMILLTGLQLGGMDETNQRLAQTAAAMTTSMFENPEQTSVVSSFLTKYNQYVKMTLDDDKQNSDIAARLQAELLDLSKSWVYKQNREQIQTILDIEQQQIQAGVDNGTPKHRSTRLNRVRQQLKQIER